MYYFVLQRYPISSIVAAIASAAPIPNDHGRQISPSTRRQATAGRGREDGVPVHDGCGDHAETRGAEALVLKRTATDLPLAMEEHRAAHRIAGLALVQPGMAVLA